VRAKPDEQEAVRAKADERTAEGIDEDQVAERAEKAFAGQAWAEGAERPAAARLGRSRDTGKRGRCCQRQRSRSERGRGMDTTWSQGRRGRRPCGGW
jgi:hypothetical protein